MQVKGFGRQVSLGYSSQVCGKCQERGMHANSILNFEDVTD